MTPIEEASSAVGDTLLGKVIAGNFRVQRLIGSGAMGNVYQAEQLSLAKEVAIKVLHPHLMSDNKLVLRFQREAKSASRLNHPNSIQIIDSGRDSAGLLYIAMELLAGRDLSQVIRDEFPLPLPRIIRVMSQVFAALDEAHAHGVIHRDLKPSNIMLIERRGESDFVKVCDYGIAKAQLEESEGEAQMLTIQGLVCGTPEYMSPEQARGEPLDGRTDLYSAAVILYQLVTGDIPFRAATPIGIVSRHLSEAPVLPSSRRLDPSIPASLDDLILRGLAKSRELRPASAAIFREELENVGVGRVGRRTRVDEPTIRSVPARTGDGQTLTVSAAESDSGSRPRPIRKSAALGVALAVCLMAGVGAVAMVRARDRGLKPGGTSGIAISAVPNTLPPSSAPAQVSSPQTPPFDKQSGVGEAVASGTDSFRDAQEGSRPMKSRPGVGPPTTREREAQRKQEGVRAAATILAARTTGAPPRGTPSPASSSSLAHLVTPTLAGAPTGTAAAPAEAPVEARSVAAVGAGGARTPRDLVGEGERLLAQGEVADACRRGEEAKIAGPRLAPVYKFLGKCYMRAGDPVRAKENYRRYLELEPRGPDAMFIESIVK